MNLLTKTTLLYLLLALLAFGFGGVLTYRMVRHEVQRETDYSLIERYQWVARSVRTGVSPAWLASDEIDIVPAGPVADTQYVFSDTLAMHPMLKRPEVLRQLVTQRQIGDAWYRVRIRDVFIEQSDISRIVINILLYLFAILGSIALAGSLLISRWLYTPFRAILDRLRHFRLDGGAVPDFPRTSTREFWQLGSFLHTMLLKIQQDYRTLKEFSENASHEMQTPLAIAQGKLEVLQEQPGLSTGQLILISEAQQSLSRLSRLNEALLLLTKIDNREFVPAHAIDFSRLVAEELATYAELAEMKGLRFTQQVATGVQVRIDAMLARILTGNLLKNAIRHNLDAGDAWVAVSLDARRLCIRNTGDAPPVPPQRLFERFQKRQQSAASTGLGLAIVKKICEVNGLGIRYTYRDGIHEVVVDLR
ncbi:MAG: hypothetical protein OHK0039_10090 [Bacteroidia bacterium]